MALDTSIHTGIVLWYDSGRGYGFIADYVTEERIFISHTAVEDLGLTKINTGSRICYDVTVGKSSCKVRRIRFLTPGTDLH